MSAEMTARALRLIQRGIDGALTEGCHCDIAARVSKVRQAERERPPAGAHHQCFRLIAPQASTLHRITCGSIQRTARSVAGSPLVRSPKSITPDKWPSLTSRLPG